MRCIGHCARNAAGLVDRPEAPPRLLVSNRENCGDDASMRRTLIRSLLNARTGCSLFQSTHAFFFRKVWYKLNETALKQLIQGGETNTVELKIAAPSATEMAERLCGLANVQGGMVIIGAKDSTQEIVGVADHKIGETLDVISRAARYR